MRVGASLHGQGDDCLHPWGGPLPAGEVSSWELLNPFLPTVPTFAVRETNVSWHNGGNSGAPLKTLRDDSALRALSSLSGQKWIKQSDACGCQISLNKLNK